MISVSNESRQQSFVPRYPRYFDEVYASGSLRSGTEVMPAPGGLRVGNVATFPDAPNLRGRADFERRGRVVEILDAGFGDDIYHPTQRTCWKYP